MLNSFKKKSEYQKRNNKRSHSWGVEAYTGVSWCVLCDYTSFFGKNYLLSGVHFEDASKNFIDVSITVVCFFTHPPFLCPVVV